MREFTLLILLLTIAADCAFGQSKGFETYKDTQYQFSFIIPVSWRVEKNPTDTNFIGICKPVPKMEMEDYYTECFEGIVF